MTKHQYFTRSVENDTKNKETKDKEKEKETRKDNKRKRETKKKPSSVTIKKKPEININVTIHDTDKETKTKKNAFKDTKRKISPKSIGMNSKSKRARDESDDEYEDQEEESDEEQSDSENEEEEIDLEEESDGSDEDEDEEESEETEEDSEESPPPRKRRRTNQKEDINAYIDSLLSDEDEDYDFPSSYDKNWMKGLSKEDVKRLEPIYDKIKKETKEEEPTILRILDSKMTFKNKCRAMQLYEIYKTLYPSSFEAMDLRRVINTMIKNSKDNDPAHEKLEEELTKILKHDISLKSRILNSKMPQDEMAILYEKYVHYEAMHDESDKNKLREYIEWALAIPQEIKPTFLNMNSKNKKEIHKYLCGIQKKLDDKLYGMRTVKEEILLTLNNMITNPSSTGHALALVGPPGVGKTEIVRSLAHSLDLPFEQISLGGAQDSSFLDGHSYTYVGARPGAIMKALKKMKYKNGIIFFDEFDKLADTEKGKEVSANLLHITDFTQNCAFRDKYLDEFKIDLSQIWFIYSLNDPKQVDSVLRDRIPMIKAPGYNFQEKIQIAKQFLIPRALKNVNLDKKELVMSDEIIGYIINKSKLKEEGVRQLNRNLQAIITRINLLKSINIKKPKETLQIDYQISNFKLPFVLDRSHVDMLFKEASEDKGPPEYMYL